MRRGREGKKEKREGNQVWQPGRQRCKNERVTRMSGLYKKEPFGEG